jgi:hypothetical protein
MIGQGDQVSIKEAKIKAVVLVEHLVEILTLQFTIMERLSGTTTQVVEPI